MNDPLSERIRSAVEQGVSARSKYFHAIDLPDEQVLGGPGDPGAIARIEARMGRRLPPSYRQFLLMFDGWRMVDGGVDLLTAADMVDGETFRLIQEWQERAGNLGDDVALRCLVIGTSNVTPTKYLLDPDIVDKSGEWQFVQHHDGVEAVVSSFLAWLEQAVGEYLELAANPLD